MRNRPSEKTPTKKAKPIIVYPEDAFSGFPFTTTFYSYKGGVGRSILAANVAGLLAAKGQKTLLWDLDIEAPGLHRIGDLASSKPNKGGFFEWLLKFEELGFDGPNDKFLKKLDQYILPIDSNRHLSLLPAHAEDASAAALYSRLPWRLLFEEQPALGTKVLRCVLRHFKVLGIENVIIDSRTGITDVGGILLAVIPHASVLIGNFGPQNLGGLKQVWRALQAPVEGRTPERDPLGPLQRVLVASPIPLNDIEAARELKKHFEKEMGIASNASLWIPENVALRQRESLLAFEPFAADSITLQAYRGVADQLLGIRHDFQLSWEEAQARAQALQAIDQGPGSVREDDDKRSYEDPLGRRFKSSSEQGKAFENDVADLLRMIGYEVKGEQGAAGSKIDLIATERGKLSGDQHYLVECKNERSPAPVEYVDKLFSQVSAAQQAMPGARGILVAHHFSPSALERARLNQVLTLTPSDLENLLLDLNTYLSARLRAYTNSKLATQYVDQEYIPEGRGPANTPNARIALIPAAMAWAKGSGSRLWVMLGDYGTGKSAFTQRFAFELGSQRKEDPRLPVPLLINLKDFPNKTTLNELLTEHWRNTTGQLVQPEVLRYLIRRGRLLLILDSFDEMGVAQAHRDVVQQFQELVHFSESPGDNELGNHVLITCREQFFRDQSEAVRAVTGTSDSLTELEKTTKQYRGQTDLLPPFDDEQIEAYLHKVLGVSKGAEAWSFIQERQVHGLKELADRPQLLDLIIKSLSRLVGKQEAINAGALYNEYVTAWLESPDIRYREGVASANHLLQALEILAVELFKTADTRLHYQQIRRLVEERQNMRGSEDPRNIDIELRTAAFLSRSPDGYYAFSHRSFLEFFLARAVHRAFTQIEPKYQTGRPVLLHDILSIKPLSVETQNFTCQLFDVLKSDKVRAQYQIAAMLRDGACPLGIRRNAFLFAHGQSWNDGLSPKAQLAKKHTQPMLVPKLLHASWTHPQGELLKMPMLLSSCDFSGHSLFCADFTDAQLEETNFTSASLEFAQFDRANLQRARLNGAYLLDASFAHADLSLAVAWGALATGVSFEAAVLNESQWFKASLQQACFSSQEQMLNADFRGARLARTIIKKSGAAAESASNQRERAKSDNPKAQPWFGASWPKSEALPAERLPRRLKLALHEAHTHGVNCVAFSPNGRRLASASDDGTIKLWDISSAQCLYTLQGGGGLVLSVAFSSDGTLLACANRSGTIKLWDIASAQIFRTLQGHEGSVESVAFSPDGTRLASASQDMTIVLWDVASERCLQTLRGHEDSVRSVAFSPDGTRIASAGRDRMIKLWDVSSAQCLNTLRGHRSGVSSVAFSPDGRRLGSASTDRTIKLWDIGSAQCLHTLEDHGYFVTSVMFSPDGSKLVSSSDDKTLKLWDVASALCLDTFEGHDGSVQTAAFSPDGTQLASASLDGSVRLWDVESMQCLHILQGHHAWVESVALSPDGMLLASSNRDHTVKLWSIASSQCVGVLQGHQSPVLSVAFSPDGKKLASGSSDNTIKLWDIVSANCLCTLEVKNVWVTSVAFSPFGKRLASAGDDGTVKLWDIASARCLHSFQGHKNWVRSVAFSPDGTRLASAGDDGTVKLWDIASARCSHTLKGHDGWVWRATFSPDGTQLASASFDDTLKLWDVASAQCLQTFEGHKSWVRSVAFSPDGTQLASAGGDLTVRLWDIASAKCLGTLQGHQGFGLDLAFAHDGTRLASASSDGLRLWSRDPSSDFANTDSWRLREWIMMQDKDEWLRIDGTAIDDAGMIDSTKLRFANARGAMKYTAYLYDPDEKPPADWTPEQGAWMARQHYLVDYPEWLTETDD
jgi:WD40 repeat protein